jgi:hypothetical protein
MHNLNLLLDRLKSLVLAADARFSPTDYTNDHIWEINRSSGDPAGLAVRTTFGLRVRSFRLIPQFSERQHTLTDPHQFESKPVIHQAFPNYALLTFAPYGGIDVIYEAWVPDSHSLALRMTLQNSGVTPRNIFVQLLCLLSPGGEGHRMVSTEIQGTTVLSGSSAGIHPTILMVGGGQVDQGPLPAYSFSMNLFPGTSYQATFVEAALENETASFEHARRIASRSWEAEKCQIELVNRDTIEIHTGNPSWNNLFGLAQQIGHQLRVGPADGLPFRSFVFARQPDLGYSPRGDGTDYNHLWNGQTPLGSYYLFRLLNPALVEEAKQWVRNFFAVQNPDNGEIDWKPGMAGQRSYLMATPLLAAMVWEIYQLTDDLEFLEESFRPLVNYLQAWFSLRHDQDGDGIPEWDHPAQIGFEEHPYFGISEESNAGADISAAESPALCALLYRECQALMQIGEKLQQVEVLSPLIAYRDTLEIAVQTSWDENLYTFAYWDRDTHQIPRGEPLGQLEGNGSLPIRENFKTPARLVMQINSAHGLQPRPLITIYGKDSRGNTVERIILPERWYWFLERGSVTTHDLFSHVESVKIQGLNSGDVIKVSSFDYRTEDLSLTFPLYARMIDSTLAINSIEKTILNPDGYWKPFGLAACPDRRNQNHTSLGGQVLLPWNSMVGSSLLTYGYRMKAAELFTHLMQGIEYSFSKNGGFTRRFSAEDGAGYGELNTLEGLPPLGFFFEVLGVQIITAWKVRLEGTNPFPWPVKLFYRGLTIERRIDRTNLTFPDGQKLTVDDPAACIVSAEPR